MNDTTIEYKSLVRYLDINLDKIICLHFIVSLYKYGLGGNESSCLEIMAL